ncbi:MAG: hypothetical protein EOP91_07880 [Lysobacteraceae bacterium]|nr:MAG: hypothetical protein EOP91_07880 [Xanthomonadaceae bacterium]
MRKIALMLLMMAATSAAHASIDSKSAPGAERTAVDVTASFAEQYKVIEADLADGETYSEISQKDREVVRGALQRISTALAQAGGIGAMSATEKAAVFNDQEVANNILTRAGADSLLVCKREKKVGSHRTTTQCATVAERRRAAEQSEKALRENQRIQMPASG